MLQSFEIVVAPSDLINGRLNIESELAQTLARVERDEELKAVIDGIERSLFFIRYEANAMPAAA
jgi:hypothetical protein